jgi:hypothetical protein
MQPEQGSAFIFARGCGAAFAALRCGRWEKSFSLQTEAQSQSAGRDNKLFERRESHEFFWFILRKTAPAL